MNESSATKSQAFVIIAALLMLGGCGGDAPETPATPSGPVVPVTSAKAVCGPGSNPESGMQGRVLKEEIDSGRAAEGYTCNTQLLGRAGEDNFQGGAGGFKVHRYVDAA
ncbi:MAG TPA: hypothetical protein VM240_07545, partial [Verrucomicrobiae bacterium]|nr:hypothetical protein [Verrucomicrobiae bacterium]